MVEGQDYIKVAYDGRLQFHDVLKEYQLDIKNFIRNRDVESMFRSCWGLQSIINPFIRKTDKEKIKKTINDCEKLNKRLSRNNNDRSKKEYEKKVFEFYGIIMDSCADLLLPTKDREVEEFDWDDFERGSDL